MKMEVELTHKPHCLFQIFLQSEFANNYFAFIVEVGYNILFCGN